MAEAADPELIRSKRKAISALFLYVVYLGRIGWPDLVDAFSRVAWVSNPENFVWHRVGPYTTKPVPPSLNGFIVLASPCVPWHDKPHNKDMVTRWVAAASEIPYTEDVGQIVVDALLQIASIDSLRPHIPVSIWAWLEKRPPLPPKCLGRSKGTAGGVVLRVRALGNIEILKSYLLLVWSEWDPIDGESGGLAEMQIAIQEDFGGIGMGRHREDLAKQLDHVLERLDQGYGYPWEPERDILVSEVECAKEPYRELKRVLLGVEGEAANRLTRTPPRFFLFGLLTPKDTYRISLDLHVRSTPSVSLTLHLEILVFLPPPSN